MPNGNDWRSKNIWLIEFRQYSYANDLKIKGRQNETLKRIKKNQSQDSVSGESNINP